MRTQFFSRNVWIGVLMAVVLALGVQGTADALTITQTSSPTVSGPKGTTFDLTFTVGLKGNTIAYHRDFPRRRVNANHANPDDPATATFQYIDSSGYPVTYIEPTDTSYRNTTGSPVSDPTGGTFVYGSRPSYDDETNQGSTGDPSLVDASGNLYHSSGNASYIRRGNGDRDATTPTAWSYTRATLSNTTGIETADIIANASALHDYNDEAIGITITPARAPTADPAITGTLELKNRGYTFVGTTAKPGTETSYTDASTAYDLKERVDIGLPTSITLVFKGASVGTHMIEIWDATPTTDFPLVGGPSGNRPRATKTFTIHVTPSTLETVPAGTDITPDNKRVPVVTDEPQQIDALFTFTAAADDPNSGNYRILYQVFRGNGILYVGTREQEFKSPPPGQTLLVHQDADVWIKMNGTSNEVHLSFAGEDRSTARARVVYEYKGKDLPGRNTVDTSGTGTTNQPPQTRTPSLSISVSGTGTTRSVTVTATNAQGTVVPGLTVTLSGSALATSQTATSGTPRTITIPSAPGSYTLLAAAAGYVGAQETFTITAPGRLALALIGAQVNGSQTVQVTARNAGGALETTAVLVTLSGAGISRTVTVTGSQNVPIPLPTASGTLTASATGYTSGSLTLPARSTTPTTTPTTTTTTTTTTGTAGEADSIEIDGSRSISGTVNQATRLRVRVLDANDRGVSGIRVTFRVLAPGRGRLSQRGNGRAVQAVTDRSGYATASLTPLGGDLIVEAKAAQVSAPVSFIINIDGETRDTSATGDTTSPQTYNVRDEIPISLEGTLTFRGSRTLNGITYTCVGSGECVVSFGTVVKGQIQAAPEKTTASQTYKVRDEIPISLEDTLSFTGKHTVNGTIYTCVGSGECVVSFGTVVKGEIRVSAVSTTTSTRTATEINPEVLIGAGQRPPMIWVDGGKIYALVGKDVQEFASGVEGAMNIAVGGGKVYWTARTGASSGTINAANLDGSDVKELASIQAIPMGIAVDPPGSKLYWTNSRGRIQSANLNGSGIQNVIQNLPSPMDITLARGILYWTQYDATESAGSIGIANPTGRGTPKHISTGANMPGSLVIGGGKVYWTKQTGESSGTIHSANLSGNGVNELASIRAVPMGIAVDTARSKLYWTNSRGRIQSAALNGSKIQNVVDGLGMPGDMVLSNSLKAPTAATPTEKASTSTASTSKYDVNGDGTVDSKDSDALIMAVAAGITDTKYDVNGDGKVDINDVVAVTANRNGGAPGAPTLLGMKLSALEVDRLQEQIDLLIATNDRSPAAMRTLVYLQQLIVMARPEKTQLLANYPNPFNPETWMPYELATDTNVKLTIYNAQGVVIRVLHLGQQSAGYYTDRERAAYWDGRNALGEQVASGIYFYQLETDDMSSLRKMVILK